MSSLEDLAASISEQVARLSSLHKELGLPPPSLDKAGSRDYATETDTPDGEALREARSRILNAAADLVRLVQGPTDHILNLTWSVSFPGACVGCGPVMGTSRLMKMEQEIDTSINSRRPTRPTLTPSRGSSCRSWCPLTHPSP